MAFAAVKIKTKLNALVVLVSLLLVAIGALGLGGIHTSYRALYAVYHDHLLATSQLNEIRNHQMQIRLLLQTARLETDAFEVVALTDRVRSEIFQIENLLKAYAQRNPGGEEKKLFDHFVEARLRFGQTGVMPMIDLLQSEKLKAVDALRKEALDPAYAQASDGIDALIGFQSSAAKRAFDGVTTKIGFIRIASITAILFGLALFVIAGGWITRSINRGVAQLQHAAHEFAAGNLTARTQSTSRDELGSVAQAFDQMAAEFSLLIGTVRQSADQVALAAHGLATTAECIGVGSQGQTHQAGVAAASVEALNDAVKHVAEKAQSVVVAANLAGRRTAHGETVVNNAVSGIQKVATTVSESAQLIGALGARSDQIGRIVGVIKDIADQTNLLALNAAIEAARAGEQGRGFAVVADEVRKLAERTSTATSEISDMIGAIQHETGDAVQAMEKGSLQVREGVDLATQTLSALKEIGNSVSDVVAMIDQIATATQSQSAATGDIATRVEQIVDMARDNGATIAQATHASHALQALSGDLQQAVSRFRL